MMNGMQTSRDGDSGGVDGKENHETSETSCRPESLYCLLHARQLDLFGKQTHCQGSLGDSQ